MSFRISGLAPDRFRHLYGLNDAALAAQGVTRVTVTGSPGFPCRVGVRDLEPGDTALLLNFTHQPADTAFHSSHAIFVQEGANERFEAVDEIPEVLRLRPLSLRAFDADHQMVDAELVAGADAAAAIARLFSDPRATYLHAHAATRGCYLALITRCTLAN